MFEKLNKNILSEQIVARPRPMIHTLHISTYIFKWNVITKYDFELKILNYVISEAAAPATFLYVKNALTNLYFFALFNNYLPWKKVHPDV